MKAILTILACAFASTLFSQNNINQTLSVNTDGSLPAASAQLDVQATDKGMLVPRMTSAQRTAIASPATGLLVFDTNTAGFWFYNGTAWQSIGSGMTGTPAMIADADSDTKIQVEESPDEDIIRFDLGGTEKMVLRKNASGTLRLELFDAQDNTFVGKNAGNANTSGSFNTANGKDALYSNTTGYYNTANGVGALEYNTTGSSNTANGLNALEYNTTGSSNTANGKDALFSNTTGSYNTANGYQALASSNAVSNTATGYHALNTNTTGTHNTANGVQALLNNITGTHNTALGTQADVTQINLTNATAIGYNAKVGCDNCMVLGGTGADAVSVGIGTTVPQARLDVNGEIQMSGAGIPMGLTDEEGGNDPLFNFDVNFRHANLNTTYRGAAFRIDTRDGFSLFQWLKRAAGNNGLGSSIMELTEAGNLGIGRTPNSNRLEVEGDASKSSAGDWLANSDARLKKNIQPLNSQLMLQSLLALQGVTYEWDDDKTGSKRPEGIQYGFTAQNIQTVFPTLVEEDKLGYLQTAYGTYDAMTVEAIRALNEKVEALKAENERLRTVEAQLEKITAALAGAGIAVEK